jgi:glutaredoxin
MTLLRRAALFATLLFALDGAACKGKHNSPAVDPAPAPIVKDDSEGYLLTWIDDKGDFHVENRVADVPMMGRDAVRVEAVPGKDDATGAERIFAADLRQARADGTYAVRTMSRTDFEAIAVARREKTGPTLANVPPPASAATTAPDPTATTRPEARALVIVYGAEWCGACHDAARYLRKKGIPYVEKDVEKDPAAAREMQQKLERRGLHAGSIPVLDVRGKVVVGFNPAEVDAALGEPL